MDEPLLGHQVVCLDGAVHIVGVDTAGDTHEHVLWSLHSLAVDLEHVRLLQGLVAKVVEAEITIVNDGRVQFLLEDENYQSMNGQDLRAY